MTELMHNTLKLRPTIERVVEIDIHIDLKKSIINLKTRDCPWKSDIWSIMIQIMNNTGIIIVLNNTNYQYLSIM